MFWIIRLTVPVFDGHGHGAWNEAPRLKTKPYVMYVDASVSSHFYFSIIFLGCLPKLCRTWANRREIMKLWVPGGSIQKLSTSTRAFCCCCCNGCNSYQLPNPEQNIFRSVINIWNESKRIASIRYHLLIKYSYYSRQKICRMRNNINTANTQNLGDKNWNCVMFKFHPRTLFEPWHQSLNKTHILYTIYRYIYIYISYICAVGFCHANGIGTARRTEVGLAFVLTPKRSK